MKHLFDVSIIKLSCHDIECNMTSNYVTSKIFVFNYRRRENSAESQKDPSGFSVKPWQGVEVEAPKPIFDLVNFDLLLRGFPSFKIVSFCFNLH